MLVGQFLKYLVAGGTAFVVHLAVLAILAEGAGVDPVWGTIAGFICAGVVNFLIQRSYVFRAQGLFWRRFRLYWIGSLLGLLLNTAVFWAALDLLGLHYLVAQVLATGGVMCMNFVFNRQITFHHSASSGASSSER